MDAGDRPPPRRPRPQRTAPRALVVPHDRVDEQPERAEQHDCLGPEDHPSLVDGVGESAAEKAEDDERNDLDGTEQSDIYVRTGQHLHLVRDDDVGPLRADGADESCR